MKAKRLYDKKLIDVEFIGKPRKTRFYKDKDGNVYPEDALEFIEYYGG